MQTISNQSKPLQSIASHYKSITTSRCFLIIKRNNKKQVLDSIADQVTKERAQKEAKALQLKQEQEQAEKQKAADAESQIQQKLEKEKDEIRKKLKRAFEENLKIKVEHQK